MSSNPNKKEYHLVIPIEVDGNEKAFKPQSFFHSWLRQHYILLLLTANFLVVFVVFYHPLSTPSDNAPPSLPSNNQVIHIESYPLHFQSVKREEKTKSQSTTSTITPWIGCETELSDPTTQNHIVPPPKGPITLVCCNTTKGVISIEVHLSWAPKGAERFLYMVKDQFFSTNVPLFRALKGFLVQFGLAGDPAVQKRYHEMGNLEDDPQWLPPGPPGRMINGITRFQKGYLAYAGAGRNSRGTQLIMALGHNQYLGGGSPWEVPWGQVIGKRSLDVLSKIYTGYGEKPSQGKIMNRGAKYIQEEFPLIDFMNACMIVKEGLYG